VRGVDDRYLPVSGDAAMRSAHLLG
jgi:hypothetical protein